MKSVGRKMQGAGVKAIVALHFLYAFFYLLLNIHAIIKDNIYYSQREKLDDD